MTTSGQKTLDLVTMKRVVLHFADATLVKGYLKDFDPQMPSLTIYPGDKDTAGDPVSVEISRLKAIFFVRSFEGNRKYRENKLVGESYGHVGKILRVTFHDGECLVGSTLEYNRTSSGFSLFPVDLSSNNTRVFVINAAVKRLDAMDHLRGASPQTGRKFFFKKWLIAGDRSQKVPLPLWGGLILSLLVVLSLGFYMATAPPGRSAARLPASIIPPAYSVGAVVEKRPDGLAYSTPGHGPLTESALGQSTRGIVLNVIREQDRWIYQVRLAPRLAVWIFESDLLAGEPTSETPTRLPAEGT
jgi:hypothetical protein